MMRWWIRWLGGDQKRHFNYVTQKVQQCLKNSNNNFFNNLSSYQCLSSSFIHLLFTSINKQTNKQTINNKYPYFFLLQFPYSFIQSIYYYLYPQLFHSYYIYITHPPKITFNHNLYPKIIIITTTAFIPFPHIPIHPLMKSSYKTTPKILIDDLKKRRQTINFIESQYNLPDKIRSPKTQKKQSYFTKDFKPFNKYDKSTKLLYTQIKKPQRANSLTPYQTDLTPKKILQYQIDSSQPKQRPLRKIHSISLVDTPKKLNLKKKTQQQLFTVKEQLNREGCKKVASAYKLANKSYSKPLRIQSTNRIHDSMEMQDGLVGIRSSKKLFGKNSQNYDIYYNEGSHPLQHSSNNIQNQSTSNSRSQLRSSKKIKLPESNYKDSSIVNDKQKSSSRTLRITRNSRSSNHGKDDYRKNSSNINNNSSKNNTKSQKGMKSPRVQQFEVEPGSSEKKFEQMFFKCSLILKKYNNQLEKLRGENESLLRENEYLRTSLSQRGL